MQDIPFTHWLAQKLGAKLTKVDEVGTHLLSVFEENARMLKPGPGGLNASKCLRLVREFFQSDSSVRLFNVMSTNDGGVTADLKFYGIDETYTLEIGVYEYKFMATEVYATIGAVGLCPTLN